MNGARTACVLLVVVAFILTVSWNTAFVQRLRSPSPRDTASSARSTEGASVRNTEPAEPVRHDTTGANLVVKVSTTDGSTPDAKVYWASSPNNQASNEGGGLFALARREGASTVHVLARGYRPQSKSVAADAAKVEFVLDAGLTIGGSVVTLDGRPLGGARVWAHKPVNNVGWPNADDLLPARLPEGNYAVTDSQGNFAIGGLHEGTFLIRAYAEGHTQMTWSKPPSAVAGSHGLRLEMAALVAIEVRAVHAVTGKPVSPVMTGFQFTKNLKLTGGLGRGETVPPSAPAGDDGNGMTRMYRSRLAAGPARVMVFCTSPGYLRGTAESEVQDNGTTRVEVRMKPAQPGRNGSLGVSAKFRDSGEAFDGWLTLSMRSRAGTGQSLIRLSGGKAKPLSLPPGRYRYTVGGAGDVGSWWQANAGEFEITEDGTTELSLALSGTLVNLEVVDPSGRPVRGYDLVVNPKAGGFSGRVARWDAPANNVLCLRWRKDYVGPDLILPAGKIRIGAWLHGVGRALVVTELKGAGDRVTIRLPLKTVSD